MGFVRRVLCFLSILIAAFGFLGSERVVAQGATNPSTIATYTYNSKGDLISAEPQL